MFLPICPWKLDERTYRGACRYSPLRQPISGKSLCSATREERRVRNAQHQQIRRNNATEEEKALERANRKKYLQFAKENVQRYRARLVEQGIKCGEDSNYWARKCSGCRQGGLSNAGCALKMGITWILAQRRRPKFMRIKTMGRKSIGFLSITSRFSPRKKSQNDRIRHEIRMIGLGIVHDIKGCKRSSVLKLRGNCWFVICLLCCEVGFYLKKKEIPNFDHTFLGGMTKSW